MSQCKSSSLQWKSRAKGINRKFLERRSTILSAHQGSSIQPFHLAIPVKDLAESRNFYGSKLGCPEGRSASTWVDFNLFGHQVVCHVVPNYNALDAQNDVDGDPVPVPHFGIALTVDHFHEFAREIEGKVEFIIKPHVRFEGQPGEQWIMFFKDPSGNALEFKAMTNHDNLFAKYTVDE